jgi:hypothetical protein
MKIDGADMIKDRKLLLEFEREFIQTEKTDYFKSLRLFEEMWNEAEEIR